jgi:hypothetical protein
MKQMKALLMALAMVTMPLSVRAAETRTPNDDMKFPSVAKDQRRPAHAVKTARHGSMTSNGVGVIEYPTPADTCDITATSCFSPNLCGPKSFGTKLTDKVCRTDGDGNQDCVAQVARTCDRYQKSSGLYECKTCS